MPSHIHPFARVDFRANHRKFGILCGEDRRRHLYLLGKTGSGKTALLLNLVASDLRAGHGLALLDPHGDLFEAALSLVPRSRANEVIVFDPADQDYPLALNVLGPVSPEHRPLIASGILETFHQVFPDFWGPRLEHLFRNCLLALLEVPGSTLLGILRLLAEEHFRQRVLRQVKDPVVRFFWLKEFTAFPRAFLAEVVSPVQNKLGAFLTSPVLRNILGQGKSKINFREAMDKGQILLANLAKGRIGEEASALLGSILVSKFQLAAMSRSRLPEEARKDFFLHVDEFPTFMTRSFARLLAEARKYHLCLTLGHQYLNQVCPEIKAALLGNVATIILFRLGAEDAHIMAEETKPEFNASDLSDLANYHVVVRLMIEGKVSRPFSAITLPPPQGQGDEADPALLRRLSRQRYGTPREKVEQQIQRQMDE